MDKMSLPGVMGSCYHSIICEIRNTYLASNIGASGFLTSVSFYIKLVMKLLGFFQFTFMRSHQRTMTISLDKLFM